MTSLNGPTADPGNAIIAHTLHWLAVLLEIDDGDASRVSAYRQAAYAVRRLDQPASAVVRISGAAGLEQLGISPPVAALIADWVKTGELPVLGDVQKRRQGLWPALTRALCKTLGIEPGERSARRPARRDGMPLPTRRPGGPIHRTVWESWN